ncbi:MAG: rod shape-determining protein MreD [Deltaproteobacteria bacterium]|nr:rod shape-determining protein MreD [Deltaproteobacteria bacterium]
MPVISYFFLGVFLLVVQTSLLTILPDWIGTPDPFFVLIVFTAMRLELVHGALLLLLLGLVMDIFSGIFLGIYPITYLLLFFVLHGLAKKLAIQEVVHRIPLVLASFLFANSLLYSFATFLAPENELPWYWKDILLQTLLLGLITMPMFNVFEAFDTLLSPKKSGLFFLRPKHKNTFRD